MKMKSNVTRAIVTKFFLLLAITGVMFTGCKDYDDDIDDLNTEVTDLKTTLSSQSDELSSVQSSLASQISSLKTQLEAAIASGDDDSKADAAAALAKAVAAQDAVDALAAELTALQEGDDVDALKGNIEDLAAEVEAINTALGSISTDLGTIDNRLGAIDGEDGELARLEGLISMQADALETFKSLINGDVERLDGSINGLTDGVAILEGDIDGINTAVGGILDDITELQTSKVSLDAFESAMEEINGKIADVNSKLAFAINSMITDITLDYYGDDMSRTQNLEFITTKARVTTVFGDPQWEGMKEFTTGESNLDGEASVVVKVTPANADLSKMVDKIHLIRSDANTTINDYISATGAERSHEILTRSLPTATGLWKVTFQLPKEVRVDDVKNLVTDGGDPILFALAVENTVDDSENAEDRFVVSDFRLSIDVTEKDPVYNDADNPDDLIFSVKNASETSWTSYEDIRNRYEFTENGISAPKDQKWSTGEYNTTSTPKADDPVDNRSVTAPVVPDLFPVAVNSEFQVKVDNADDVYAYYITIDKDWAVESSPSEINAWTSYNYEGLEKVYDADETASLKITSSSANGDIIGFRVFVVNYDGTLVDPDGKSFYVYVGDVTPSPEVAFKQVISTYVASGVAVPSDMEAAPNVTWSNVSGATFNMTIGHGVTLDASDLELYGASNNLLGTADAVSNWSSVSKLRVIHILPTDLQEGMTYTGTLTLLNSFNVPFSTTTVSLTKELPTFTDVVDYKTNIHHNVNGEQVVYAYPIPGTREYNLSNALNGIGDGTGYFVENASTYPLLPAWAVPAGAASTTVGVVPVAEIGVPYGPNAVPGHGKIYDLKLAQDFGSVKYDGTGGVYWDANPAIKVEFRSFIQDLTDWRCTAPTLVYASSLTGYNVANITALPPAGSRINMTQNEAAAANLQDLRSFSIIDVIVLTGSNFTIENEYFTPIFNSFSETIDFTPVVTSPPAGSVATKIALILEDDFGHQYKFVVPQAFNMVLN